MRRSTVLLAAAVLLSGVLPAAPAAVASPPAATNARPTAAGAPPAATGSSRVEIEGTLTSAIADDFDSGRSENLGYRIDTATGSYKVDGPVSPTLVGQRVAVTGRKSGATVAVEQGGIRATGDAPSAVASFGGDLPASSAFKVAVIMLSFSDVTTRPWTTSEIHDTLIDDTRSVAAYYKEVSEGAVTSFTSDEFGWYEIPFAAADACDVYDWAVAADAKAADDGFKASDYTHVVYAMPRVPGCWWAGLGELGGHRTWVNSVSTLVVAHELGHNLGFHHAGAIECTDQLGLTPLAMSASCAHDPTNDPFDIMGYWGVTKWPSGAHLALVGWIPPGSIDTVTADGTYHLAPLESSGAHRLIVIPRGRTSEYYPYGSDAITLELRRSSGLFDTFAPTDPAVNGVSVRIAPAEGIAVTWLVDTTPETSSAYGAGVEDAQLTVGRTLVDPVEGLAITATAVGTDGATVEIHTVTLDQAAPAIDGPALTPAGTNPGTRVAVSAGLQDASGVHGAWARIDTAPWAKAVLGDAPGSTSTTTVFGFGSPLTEVGAEGSRSCVLDADGVVSCSGGGLSGDGTIVVAGLPESSDIAVGGSFTCALEVDQHVRCWGTNDDGQLGDGTLTSRDEPAVVEGLEGVVAIAAGRDFACALTAARTAWCWGASDASQLGDDAYHDFCEFGPCSPVPVQVAGITTATSIGLGARHACAVLADTTVRCWGLNDHGQLGDGSVMLGWAPVAVSGLAGVTRVAGGTSHTCALLLDHTVRCWGSNGYGEIGDGTTTERQLATAVTGLGPVVGIAAGGDEERVEFSCAAMADGSVRCWGGNDSGQLGDGTTVSHPVPGAVHGVAGATSIAAGAFHACALVTGGSLRCWGRGAYGELFEGSRNMRLTANRPTAVGALASGGHLVCVAAVDGVGNAGDGSACAALTVSGPLPQPTLEILPAGQIRVLTDATLKARLTGPGGTPLAGRTIEFELGGRRAAALTDASGTASAVLPAPRSAVTYVEVAAFGGDDSYGAAAAASLLTVRGYGLPQAPLSVVAVAGEESATVSWAPPSDDGGFPLYYYDVLASPGGERCSADASDHSCTVGGLANGVSYTFTVTATNEAGTGPASAPSASVVPGGPPVVAMTTLPTWSLGSSIGLAWTVQPGVDEVTGYDVRYRRRPWNGAFGPVTPLLAGSSVTSVTSASLAVTPGATYCATALARYASGATSAWSPWTCTAVPLDDRRLKAGSGWTSGTGSAFFRGTFLRAKSRGSTLTRSGIVARKVAIVVQTCPTCGSLDVIWNGRRVRTVSLASATTVNRKVITVLSFGSIRSGTLKLRVHSAGRRVIVDGIGVRGV